MEANVTRAVFCLTLQLLFLGVQDVLMFLDEVLMLSFIKDGLTGKCGETGGGMSSSPALTRIVVNNRLMHAV